MKHETTLSGFCHCCGEPLPEGHNPRSQYKDAEHRARHKAMRRKNRKKQRCGYCGSNITWNAGITKKVVDALKFYAKYEGDQGELRIIARDCMIATKALEALGMRKKAK